MDNNYSSEYETDEKKKFQITRGMVILASVVLVVIVIVIIIIVNAVNSKKPEYTTADFNRLESRMEEEAMTYLSQKGIELTSEEVKIDLKDLLSENPSVKELAMELMEECSSETLNRVIRRELKGSRIGCGFERYNYDLVLKILNCKKLQLDEHLRKKLSKTEIWRVRNWIAQDKDTSNEILNDMILAESRDFILYNSVVVFDSIVLNPNFKMKEKTKNNFFYYYTKESYTAIMERIETVT